MSSSSRQQALALLGMTEDSGLVSTDRISAGSDIVHPRAKRILRDARALGASYVLFRFPENAARAPAPQAFIFDYSDSPIASTEEAKIQRKVWNTGLVPLIFVIQTDRVDIVNALKKPEVKEGVAQPLTVVAKMQLASNISATIKKKNEQIGQRFSGERFANGTFWDAPENRSLLADSTAQKTLLQEMRNAHEAIEARSILTPDLTRRFFILCLMVKYLEDRKILRLDFFKDFHLNATTFEDLLRIPGNDRAALRRCLKQLAIRFNGDVFSLSPDEEKDISIADLTIYADFVSGRLEGAQLQLWDLYSFEYLPVELISYIYEDFLRDNKKAVYTPHILVDLLLDEVMPTKQIPADYRILDPACGSGVFLVGAFRRLVEGYLADNPELSPGQVPAQKLCSMLTDNIRGVDIDPVAVELTSFSLCVAMCAELSPESARAEMRFPTLAGKISHGKCGDSRSIRECDFFKLTAMADGQHGTYDLIIGNPPFGSNEEKNLAAEVALNTSGPRVPFPPLPDKQLCYLFLRDAPKLLKEGGVGCLLQKDGFLYNGGVLEFRAAFLKNYEVPQIFDFVSIRGMFTGRKAAKEVNEGEKETDGTQTVDVKAVAIFFRRLAASATHTDKPILHTTFRKLFTVAGHRGFELDAYDYHWVSRKVAIEDPRVWKANLLGGGRLLATYRSILSSSEQTVGEFLKKRSPGWAFSEGYAVGEKGAKPESKLTGMTCIKRDRTDRGPVDWSRTELLKKSKFKSTGDLRIYTPPHLIIWKHESLAAHFRDAGEDLAFTKRFFGIACPMKSTEELRRLAIYLESAHESLLFLAAFGNEFMGNRTNTILTEDLLDLPYPESRVLSLRGVEGWLKADVLRYQIPFVKEGAFVGSELFENATAIQLTQYTEVFLKVLQNVYAEAKLVERHEFTNAHCVAFTFGNARRAPFGDAKELERFLDELLLKQRGRALRIHRIVRLFDCDTLYYVKPKAYRFWTRSIAIRDADEAFASLVEQGF